MNNESWLVIHPTSNWVNYNSKMILYLSPITISVLIHSITSHESWIVSHDSRVIPPLRVIHNSKIIQPIPIYSLCAYILTVYNMNHESWLWVILPLVFLAEDVHTIALINSWKFHRDWAKHLGTNLWQATGFPLSPHTPLYTFSRLRRLDKPSYKP